MLRVIALAVLLLVLVSGCSQATPPTGGVVGTGEQPSVSDAGPPAKTPKLDTSKDQCPPPAVCLEKPTADYKCIPSHWCGKNGSKNFAGNKPYCCKER